MSITQVDVFALIEQEREYQDQKWGGADFDDHNTVFNWFAYIMLIPGRKMRDWRFTRSDFITAMTKIAALAVAAIEWADRHTGDEFI